MLNLLKTNHKNKFLEVHQTLKFLVWPSVERFKAEKLAALMGVLLIISIGKVLKADQKKSLFCYKYW